MIFVFISLSKKFILVVTLIIFFNAEITHLFVWIEFRNYLETSIEKRESKQVTSTNAKPLNLCHELY